MSEISLESLLASKQQEESNTKNTSLVPTQKELQPIEENTFSEKDVLQIKN